MLVKDVEKRKPSYTVSGNVNWCSHCGKQYGSFSKKLKTELPYDPAIPLLGIYPKKMKTLIQKDICTPMFRAALFIIAKIQKHPKCSSTDKWIKKLCNMHTHTHGILLSHKKE